jgi:hypothetical protein
VPDLDLDGAPADTIFGLLHPARFVLLNRGSAAAAPAGYAGRLDVVTAKLAADDPEWTGVRALLIRPDGYIAWATDTDDAPPLAAWLGPALARRSLARRSPWPAEDLSTLAAPASITAQTAPSVPKDRVAPQESHESPFQSHQHQAARSLRP